MQGIAAIGVEKYKNFLGENTPRPHTPPPTLNAIPHQTVGYQQTIYHFSTLGIVWSLFVDGPPPTDEFLKNALPNTSCSVCHLFCMRYIQEIGWEEAQVKCY
jgi:hypothetical protein